MQVRRKLSILHHDDGLYTSLQKHLQFWKLTIEKERRNKPVVLHKRVLNECGGPIQIIQIRQVSNALLTNKRYIRVISNNLISNDVDSLDLL